jgi:hypothetical protein
VQIRRSASCVRNVPLHFWSRNATRAFVYAKCGATVWVCNQTVRDSDIEERGVDRAFGFRCAKCAAAVWVVTCVCVRNVPLHSRSRNATHVTTRVCQDSDIDERDVGQSFNFMREGMCRCIFESRVLTCFEFECLRFGFSMSACRSVVRLHVCDTASTLTMSFGALVMTGVWL